MPHFGALTEQQNEAYKEMVRLAFVESPENNNWYFKTADLNESRALIDDDGTVLVGMRIIKGGALYFNAPTPIPTALITSVASSPEYRRKGHIREMFAGMFAEQRANGVHLTALYPFYFPFYRAFGYEHVADGASHTVELGEFKHFRKAAETGKFTPATVKDWQTLKAIYDVDARQGMGFVERVEDWWKFILSHERLPQPSYIYHNAAGQPAGYITYHFKDKGNWDRDMIVHDIRAIDRPAFEALLGFLYNHDSQAEKVKLTLPPDYPLATQLPDPRKDKIELWKGYMLRLLDIGGAIQARTFGPEVQAEFTMSVTDSMVAENVGTYQVRVRDGRASVEKSAASGNAGLSLDQMALAQLYAGYLNPVAAAGIGRIAVNSEADLRAAQVVFSPAGQRAAFMPDEF